MENLFTRLAFALGGACIGTPAVAGPSICTGTMTELELVHRVGQDAYFTHNAPIGSNFRVGRESFSAHCAWHRLQRSVPP